MHSRLSSALLFFDSGSLIGDSEALDDESSEPGELGISMRVIGALLDLLVAVAVVGAVVVVVEVAIGDAFELLLIITLEEDEDEDDGGGIITTLFVDVFLLMLMLPLPLLVLFNILVDADEEDDEEDENIAREGGIDIDGIPFIPFGVKFSSFFFDYNFFSLLSSSFFFFSSVFCLLSSLFESRLRAWLVVLHSLMLLFFLKKGHQYLYDSNIAAKRRAESSLLRNIALIEKDLSFIAILKQKLYSTYL